MRVMEYNEKVREQMRIAHDRTNSVEEKVYPKVGDRVYVRSPSEKARETHPKLICEWTGPFRVLNTS